MLKQHPHLILDATQAERATLTPGKATAILPTCQADLKFLVWSTLSLLLRTPRQHLSHLIVTINGSNKIQGTALQDRKQEFVEELIGLGEPVSLQRTWGHIGHTQAVEACIPWVETEFYLMMHDDVIVDPAYLGLLIKSGFIEDETSGLIGLGPIILSRIQRSYHEGVKKLGLPHLNTAFTLVRKNVVTLLGKRWMGFHVPHEFVFDESWAAMFLDYYRKQGLVKEEIEFGEFFGVTNSDVGSYVLYAMHAAGYKVMEFKGAAAHHVRSASWSVPDMLEKRMKGFAPIVQQLEEEIAGSRFAELYRRYAP